MIITKQILKLSIIVILCLTGIGLHYVKAGSDSIYDWLRNSKDETKKVNYYIQLIKSSNSNNKYDNIEFIKEGLNISQIISYKWGIITLNNCLGEKYRKIGMYDSALYYCNLAYELAKAENDTLSLISALNSLGVIYRRTDEMQHALDCHSTALYLAEKIKDIKTIAIASNSIGNINITMRNYLTAKIYLEKSLEIQKQLNDTLGEAINYNNLGEVYEKTDEYEKALEYYNISLNKNILLNNNKGIAINYNSIAKIYRNKGELYESLKYYKKALALDRTSAEKYFLANSLVNIGDICTHIKDYNQAFEYLNEGINIAEKIGSKYTLQNGYEYLANLYAITGDYKKALEYFKISMTHKDNILNEQTSGSLVKMNAKYESAKKQAQIFQLEGEKKKESNKLNIAFLLIIIIMLVAVSYWHKSNKDKKFNKILVEKNNIIEDANNRLQEQNHRLSELNATQNRLLSIIGHDIKNPLHAIYFTMDTLINFSERFTSEKLKKTYFDMMQSAKQLNDLLENLLHWAKTQNGTINYNPNKIKLTDIVEDSISIYKMSIEKKNISITNMIKNDFSVFADLNMLNTIIRNLISNAIKFSKIGGLVEISAEDYVIDNSIDNEQYKYKKISIKDNGVGINAEKIRQLFQMGNNISTQGTENEKGTGLGLVLVREFVDINHGEIWVESEIDKGTTFSFILPEGL